LGETERREGKGRQEKVRGEEGTGKVGPPSKNPGYSPDDFRTIFCQNFTLS